MYKRFTMRCVISLPGLLFTNTAISSSFAQKIPIMPFPSQYNFPVEYQRATGKRITKFSEMEERQRYFLILIGNYLNLREKR